MKPIRILLILLSLGGILFTSCRKVHSSNPNSNPNDTVGVLLTKIVQLDTLVATGHDTASIIIYNYDSLKRLADCITYAYDTTNGNIETATVDTILYQGNNNNPYQAYSFSSILEGEGAGQVNEVIEHFYYDNTGRISYVTTPSQQIVGGYDTTVYVFNNAQNIVSHYSENYVGGAYRDTAVYTSTGTTDDIVSANYALYNGQINGAPTYYFNYDNISYDTHKNPFATISGAVFLNLASSGYLPTGYFGGDFIISSNNVTSLLTTESQNQSAPYTLSYNASSFVYNSNDYPVSCRYRTTVPYGVPNQANQRPAAGVALFYYSN